MGNEGWAKRKVVGRLGSVCMEQGAAAGLGLLEIGGCFGWWPVFGAEMAWEIGAKMARLGLIRKPQNFLCIMTLQR